MARTRVKICGLTNVTDALMVANAGADAVGLVFYAPSPRHVEIEQACSIAKALPAFVTKTALFVNPDASYVKAVLEQVQIDLLQFHGDETPEFCQQFGLPYMKAIRMQATTDLTQLAEQYASSCGILLDAYKPGVPGGTGEQFNWDWVPKTLSKPIILAGGLTAENIHQAIQITQPWAVDVSGGVEASKGLKSPEKVTLFMQQVMRPIE
ncbi:MAG: phosphoribosylanthranilate isomerase [Thiotrichales bacterium]|nr:phosphoribosylanthranilate isomerase [Thiotrichales bacterium]